MNIELTVVAFKQQGLWIAQCLEYDICTQAKTIQQLCHSFLKILVTYVHVARERGVEPLRHLPEAPDYYWRFVIPME